MLAPNPQTEAFVSQRGGTKATSAKFEKFVFTAVLVVAYAIVVAALVYPVVVYVFW